MQRPAAESSALLPTSGISTSHAVPSSLVPNSDVSMREGPGSEMRKESNSKARIAVFQITFVLLNSALAIVWRWQSTVVVDDKTGRTLSNPVSQSLLVVGLFPLFEICRYVYVTRFFSTPREDTGEPVRRMPGVNCPTEDFGWLAAAPLGFLQALMNVSAAVATPHVGATVVQVLRSSKLPFAALISFVFIGRRFSKGKVSGIVVLVAGALCIALTTPHQHGDSKDESLVIMGVVFFVAFVSAVRSVFEERVMDRYMATELDLVGKEGTIAFLISVAFALLCVAVPASWGMPDPLPFWSDMWANQPAFWSTLIIAILNPMKAGVGLGVTKLTSAVAMIVTGQAKVLVVAVVSAVLLSERFSVYQLIGYAVMLFGLITYFGMGPVSALFRTTASTAEQEEPSGTAQANDADMELSRLESRPTTME